MYMRLRNVQEGITADQLITDPTAVAERTGTFTPRGLFSEEIFGRMTADGADYSCDCGATRERFLEGTLAPCCNSRVVTRELRYDRNGGISLGQYKIIAPIARWYLQRVIGPTQLSKIIAFNHRLTVDGNQTPDVVDPAAPYNNIGLHAFASKWVEIVEFYVNARKNSDPRIVAYAKILIDNPDWVLTNIVPVFSPILRPALVAGKTVMLHEVNTPYGVIINMASTLRSLTAMEVTPSTVNECLSAIQAKANEVEATIFKLLAGKGGFVRDAMLGARFNFAGRAVIAPLGIGHEQDEVAVPYATFLELYRFELLNLITKLRRVTLMKAEQTLTAAQDVFDPSVYALMMQLINRGGVDGEPGLPCLLNRAPTIAFGSILRVRITMVHANVRNKVLYIHNGILGLLGADYDGRRRSL